MLQVTQFSVSHITMLLATLLGIVPLFLLSFYLLLRHIVDIYVENFVHTDSECHTPGHLAFAALHTTSAVVLGMSALYVMNAEQSSEIALMCLFVLWVRYFLCFPILVLLW